jgi:hypothetical protein
MLGVWLVAWSRMVSVHSDDAKIMPCDKAYIYTLQKEAMKNQDAKTKLN